MSIIYFSFVQTEWLLSKQIVLNQPFQQLVQHIFAIFRNLFCRICYHPHARLKRFVCIVSRFKSTRDDLFTNLVFLSLERPVSQNSYQDGKTVLSITIKMN